MAEQRKLYKDRENGKVSGVLAGMAEYFDLDVALIRIAFLFLVVFTGFFPGVLFYIIAAAVMDDKPGTVTNTA